MSISQAGYDSYIYRSQKYVPKMDEVGYNYSLRAVHARSSMRAVWESGLKVGPDSLIKRPNFKIIYNFLIKYKG